MWALTNKALTVPPGGVHITHSGTGPGELNAKTFTSTKYPNLIKQSNGRKMANTWKINDFSAYVHTHTKGNCSHIHPQPLQ